MTRLQRTLTVGIGVMAIAACQLAAQTRREPIFVSPEQLDVASILPNPPANDSPETKAELLEMHRLQDTRQAAQIAHVRADDAEEDIFVYRDVIGERFNRDSLPLTTLLSAHVHSDEGVIVGPAKKFFRRTRPFHFDATIQPVCRTNNDLTDYAYPSGHSTTGYLEALVLTLIVPEKRDVILARADDYAHSRVVCGVHYPTDVLASKSVAYAMIAVMLNNTQFQQELASARAETRRVLGLPVTMNSSLAER